MALVHYGVNVRRQNKEAFRKVRTLERTFSNERRQRRELQSEVLDLRDKSNRVEETESKLKMWESRKPKIYHYLGVFGEMMK